MKTRRGINERGKEDIQKGKKEEKEEEKDKKKTRKQKEEKGLT